MADFRIAAVFASQLESTRDFVATEAEPLDLAGFRKSGPKSPGRLTRIEQHRLSATKQCVVSARLKI